MRFIAMKINGVRYLSVALVLAGGLQAFASTLTPAFDFTPIIGATQQGWPGNLASLFVVAPGHTVTISDLGVFNQSGTGFITGTIKVALFNVTTDLQISPTVTFGPNVSYTPVSYAVYQSITPVTLGPGTYAVDAVGFSASDTNGNNGFGGDPTPGFNTFGGALTFPTPGSFYDSNTSLDLANISDPHLYEAGNFEVSAVPEGGSALGFLLLAAAVTLGAMRLSKPVLAV
jgi:hypothetical protein